MAVKIPESAYKQVSESYALDASGVKTRRVVFKDKDFDGLQKAANAIAKGDAYDGWIVGTWDLTTVPGGGGALTLSLVPDSSDTGGSTTAMRAVWTCKSVRNDVSILAYCGGSASRVNIELWQKETEQKLAEAYTFHVNKLSTSQLNSQEQKIAEKISKGVDSVIRFYAVLSCTSYWSKIPDAIMEDIGYSKDPAERSAQSVEKPANLATIVSKHSWLKVQDDIAEQSGVFVRTESWMGLPKTDASAGWDADLYGENRWEMPLA